jgi:hypothetical protein
MKYLEAICSSNISLLTAIAIRQYNIYLLMLAKQECLGWIPMTSLLKDV